MKTSTITFPDGYKVTITEERVTITHNGRSQWDKSIYFRPITDQSFAAKLRAKNIDPAAYLWNGSELKPVLVRTGEGVAEAITEATAAERAEREAAETERKVRWMAERAADNALTAEAKAKATRIRETIPVNEIEVEIRVTGNLDGDECREYWAEGVELKYSDLRFVGAASAVRPGAQGAFYTEAIYTVSRSRLDEIKSGANTKASAAEAEIQQLETARAAKFAEAARSGQPVALESWVENRTVREGRDDCEYLFIVTKYAMPDGSTKEKAVNTY